MLAVSKPFSTRRPPAWGPGRYGTWPGCASPATKGGDDQTAPNVFSMLHAWPDQLRALIKPDALRGHTPA
jgi:hypothetical protein